MLVETKRILAALVAVGTDEPGLSVAVVLDVLGDAALGREALRTSGTLENLGTT